MSEHTPTPWQSHGGHIYSPDKKIICQVHNPGSKESDYPLVENVAFIVRACNAHEALVEALTELYSETADYVARNNLGEKHHKQSMKMARAALALARGEEVPNAR